MKETRQVTYRLTQNGTMVSLGLLKDEGLMFDKKPLPWTWTGSVSAFEELRRQNLDVEFVEEREKSK